MAVRLQAAPFDYGGECASFADRAAGAGAIVSFLGVVRDERGSLARMEIEHYPGMTQRALESIEAEARARWDLTDILILHRHGTMAAGEPIMMVATGSRHRKAAFEAAEFLMDYLKSRAPFWKKEHHADRTDWVAARAEDESALKRWR